MAVDIEHCDGCTDDVDVELTADDVNFISDARK